MILLLLGIFTHIVKRLTRSPSQHERIPYTQLLEVLLMNKPTVIFAKVMDLFNKKERGMVAKVFFIWLSAVFAVFVFPFIFIGTLLHHVFIASKKPEAQKLLPPPDDKGVL